jgi:putative ABC transport system substrate-binding protein
MNRSIKITMKNPKTMGVITAIFLFAAAHMFGSGFTATAQTPARRIGVLVPGKGYEPVLAGLRDGLAKLGYKDGTGVTYDVEVGNSDASAQFAAAEKLLQAKPDLIFAVTPQSALAAKRATSTVPIVFVSVGAPVEAGLVAAFASSGNNLTGVSSYAAALSGKRLELLRDIAPKTKKILLVAWSHDAVSQLSARHSEEAARRFGMQILSRDVASVGDVEKLLLERWAGPADAVSLVPGAAPYIDRFIAKANKERLPTIVYEKTLVEMGALASYGSERFSTGAQAATLVVKLLKGAKPWEIPIETPAHLIMTINRTTAKTIGLKIPEAVLERADLIVD